MPIDNTQAALADLEIHYLQSKHVGDEFKIFVAHPVMPVAPGTKVPVIYALDANIAMGIVTDTARAMSMEGAVPPAFVVGIGYRTGWLIPDAYVKRARDFTPTPMPAFDELGAAMIPGGAGLRCQTGHADRFLRFLREELKPFIEARYGVDPADATVTGASLGGLFPLVTLLTAPDTFQRYLACSPSLWWDDEWLLRQEKIYAEQQQDLAARVFVAAGGEETHENVGAHIAALPEALRPLFDAMLNRDGKLLMVEYLDSIVPALRARSYPGLRIAAQRFDRETHGSVYGAAVARGLRVLFAKD